MKKYILIIMSSLGGGGAEKVLVTMLQHFDYSKFNVELCLIVKSGIYVNAVPKNVKLTVLYENPVSWKAKIDYNVYSKLNVSLLERMCIRNRVGKHYDAIISFCEGRSLKFHSYITDRTENNVTWIHTDLDKNHHSVGKYFKISHEFAAYNAMQQIIFVSNDAKKQFGKLYPSMNIDKQKVIYNIIDKDYIESFMNKDHYNQIFSIVCVGGLRKEKAFDRVVRLAKKLKLEGLRFHIKIIGDGEGRTKLQKQIDESQVSDCVDLVGFLNPPYEELSKAHLFLSTSITEGFPLVVCEALCSELPIVATKCTGPIEVLENGKYGLLVDPNDTAIYEGVKLLMTDEKERQKYVELSKVRKQMFDVSNVMNQIYKLF